MSNLIEVQLDNGRTILIESSLDDCSDDLMDPVTGNKVVKKTKEFLNTSFDQIKSFSTGISESISDIEIKPDEIEVEFAVKFSADAGIIISSVGTEASITIKLKWDKSKGVQ